MQNSTKYSKGYFEARKAGLDVAYNALKPDWQDLADYFLPRSVRFLARNVNKQPVKMFLQRIFSMLDLLCYHFEIDVKTILQYRGQAL